MIVSYKRPPDVISAEKLCSRQLPRVGNEVNQNRMKLKPKDWFPEKPSAKKTPRTA